MTLSAWPSTLPQRLMRENNGFRFGENRVSFQPDQGAPLDRRTGTAGPDEFSGSVVLASPTLFTTFQTFFKTTLKQGTLPFTWTHPVTAAACTCKIIGRPELAPVGGGAWRLQLTLLLLP